MIVSVSRFTQWRSKEQVALERRDSIALCSWHSETKRVLVMVLLCIDPSALGFGFVKHALLLSWAAQTSLAASVVCLLVTMRRAFLFTSCSHFGFVSVFCRGVLFSLLHHFRFDPTYVHSYFLQLHPTCCLSYLCPKLPIHRAIVNLSASQMQCRGRNA
ncbi:hypothetical protein EDC04DRAFT_1704676 [Pisolithus marmoratus]|nr:hypothetical protein EDC04DRAFT_1704676 [Pisolithus marmoratus]